VHEPLVDEETFERAHTILARRFEDASLRRGNPSDFLLSGLVRCASCGRAYVGTSAHGNGGRYVYYACSTRYKYGPAKCEGDRLPKEPLEEAVLAQLADIYRHGHLIEQALTRASERAESQRPQLEERLASTRTEVVRLERKLERYFEAFEEGELSPADCRERIQSHRDRLETLRAQEADLSRMLATEADEAPDRAALAALVGELEVVLANENPEQAKELLRLLVKEIRVHNRRRTVPIYRVPAAVRAIPRKVGRTEYCANQSTLVVTVPGLTTDQRIGPAWAYMRPSVRRPQLASASPTARNSLVVAASARLDRRRVTRLQPLS
jgi:site-specific DNA recombinase